ncbi:MAG: exodeoxyribonuclease VII large subunit [Candidatus Omnitrophota bacterium]
MNTTPEKHIFTVSELARESRALLEAAFTGIWVEGEISNFIAHSSGHLYFSLKDENALISCAMFRGENRLLKFQPKDGMRVLCQGRVSLYDKQGKFQFYAQAMEPRGLGALQLAFQQLKEKLEKEGLFESARKRALPMLPRRIGIVTSPTGAAIRDMLTVAGRRFQNVEILINPVRVQGDGAAKEIANAVEEFNDYGKVDVIIVARGGGSLEDLWPFNEEIVARAIFASRIPVISAVGHEIDFTIADFVADLRAPTPSAAAEMVLPEKEQLLNDLEDAYRRMTNSFLRTIQSAKQRLTQLKESYILRQPMNLVEQMRQRIDETAQRLDEAAGALIEDKKSAYALAAGKLDALSPLAVLARGYSITRYADAGALIKEALTLKPGDRVETRLARGSFTSIVERAEESHG